MAYTVENFRQDLAQELVVELPPEERLRGFSEAELQQLQQWLQGKLRH